MSSDKKEEKKSRYVLAPMWSKEKHDQWLKETKEDTSKNSGDTLYTLLPITRPYLADCCDELKDVAYWRERELDWRQERQDWKKLDEGTQFFLKTYLSFLAVADGVINANLAEHFMGEFNLPETRYFFANQIANEAEHGRTYARQLEECIEDPKERDELINGVKSIACVKKKVDWATKYANDSSLPLVQRVFAFYLMEFMLFPSAFAAFFWVRTVPKFANLLNALYIGNVWIFRDENIHGKFGFLLGTKTLKVGIPECVAHQMIHELIEIDKEFVTYAMSEANKKGGLPGGLTVDKVTGYTDYIANCICLGWGFKEICPSQQTNPLPFMDNKLGFSGKSNMFDTTTPEYSKSSLPSSIDDIGKMDLSHSLTDYSKIQ